MNEDPLRHILERTLKNAKKRQNPESGFLAIQDHVSLYDNFLFCLALFRAKGHVEVLDAKKLLERLLYFQQGFQDVANMGNFPLLLSDYPFCHDHFQALRILPVLIWIQRDFSPVLGVELTSRLEQAIGRLVLHLLKVHEEIKFPTWAKCKLYSVLFALGKIAPEIAPNLQDRSDLRTWGDPGSLAEMIIAYQLAPRALDWQPFLQYLLNTWHKSSRAFIGPAFKLGKQNDFLNIAMGLFTGRMADNIEVPLTCALLRDSEALKDLETDAIIRGSNERFSWSVMQDEKYGYSMITGRPSPEYMPGFFSFYLVTGQHSLAIQAPLGYMSREYVFEVDEAVFSDEKEKSKALMIWFDDHKECEVLVAGLKATCFEFGTPLEIRLGDLRVSISFELLAGDGQFIGHISRSNRSGAGGADRMHASDVQIFLRAVRGTSPCTLRMDTFIS